MAAAQQLAYSKVVCSLLSTSKKKKSQDFYIRNVSASDAKE